jgi:hypothetical protein
VHDGRGHAVATSGELCARAQRGRTLRGAPRFEVEADVDGGGTDAGVVELASTDGGGWTLAELAGRDHGLHVVVNLALQPSGSESIIRMRSASVPLGDLLPEIDPFLSRFAHEIGPVAEHIAMTNTAAAAAAAAARPEPPCTVSLALRFIGLPFITQLVGGLATSDLSEHLAVTNTIADGTSRSV